MHHRSVLFCSGVGIPVPWINQNRGKAIKTASGVPDGPPDDGGMVWRYRTVDADESTLEMMRK